MLNFEKNKCHEPDKGESSPPNLEAMERLSGGLAHELNNLLCVILNYSSVLLEQMEPEDPKACDIMEIKSATERAAGLTHQLLAFGRGQILKSTIADINIIIADMERFIRAMMVKDIELVFNLKNNLGKIMADPEQIKQVIVNLVANANDAMTGGGQLAIETETVFFNEEYVTSRPGLKPGNYVELMISDTGHGMDIVTQSHIFDPFFTTRDKNKRKGLGLSAAYGIIKQSQGHILVHSEPGHGAIFKIYFPIVAQVKLE